MKRIKHFIISIYEKYYYDIQYIFWHFEYDVYVMSSLKTISYIQKKKCNISRYGDGEFRIMLASGQITFQSASESLKDALIDVLPGSAQKKQLCSGKNGVFLEEHKKE